MYENRYLKSLSFFLLIIFFFPSVTIAKSTEGRKRLPSFLQKAYVVQRDAIVYSRPDFDSLKITQIPAGTMVTISKKVYKPKTLFGTFYHVYLMKPKKMRAYISEVDVVPRYIKAGSQYKINPEFKQARKKLDRIEQFEVNRLNTDEGMDFSDKPVFDKRFIGMTAGYSRLGYADYKPYFSAWFFGLKLSGPGLPIPRMVTDINVMFSATSPVINGYNFESGFVILGDILFKVPLINAPFFLFYLAGGLMMKWKGVFVPPIDSPPTRYELGAGVAASLGLLINIRQYWGLLVESKLYYDIREYRFVPLWSAGVLVGF